MHEAGFSQLQPYVYTRPASSVVLLFQICLQNYPVFNDSHLELSLEMQQSILYSHIVKKHSM